MFSPLVLQMFNIFMDTRNKETKMAKHSVPWFEFNLRLIVTKLQEILYFSERQGVTWLKIDSYWLENRTPFSFSAVNSSIM